MYRRAVSARKSVAADGVHPAAPNGGPANYKSQCALSNRVHNSFAAAHLWPAPAAGMGNLFMRGLSHVTLAFVLAGATAVWAQQFPPQPAAPQTGNDAERAACRPDVVKFCQVELSNNQDDPFTILACLQRNRTGINAACQQVLANHGQ